MKTSAALVALVLLSACTPEQHLESDASIDAARTDASVDAASPDATLDAGADAFVAPPLSIRGAVASHLALEILQPTAGLDDSNRFYRAYPGLPFDVQIAAIGGNYPYRYELVAGPTGMSVDTIGTLHWEVPVEMDATHEVTVEVIDQVGARASVSWSIHVTAERWLFVDASATAPRGDGTYEDPFVVPSLADVYHGDFPEASNICAKDDTRWQGYFLYFRDGTYALDGFSGGTTVDRTGCVTTGPRTAAVQWTERKPHVWLAYPGTHPQIDLSEHYLLMDRAPSSWYMEGLDVGPATNPESHGFRTTGENITVRHCRFHELPEIDGNNNQAFLGFHGGRNVVVVDNRFSDFSHGYGVIGYSADRVLIERNEFTDLGTGGPHAIGPKASCTHWIIRGNHVSGVAEDGFAIWLYGAEREGPFGDIEVSYNLLEVEAAHAWALEVNRRGMMTRPVYVFRNTIVGGLRQYVYVGETFAESTFHHNVLDGAAPTCDECASPERMGVEDNLFGPDGSISNASGEVDPSLPGYDGTQGHTLVEE